MVKNGRHCLVTFPAPAAEAENKRAEREETAGPPAVQEKRQPVVSSSLPAARITPPVNPPVNNTAPPRPPPDPTEDEDEDEYDSDDASKTDFSSQTEPHERVATKLRC